LVGDSPVRPVAAYLTATLLGATVAVAQAAPVGDAGSFPVLLVGAALGFIPAATLTLELAHRVRPGPIARALIGAMTWAMWCAIAAAVLAIVSRLTLVPDVLAGDLILCAGAGAAFAALGLSAHPGRPHPALVVVALALTVLLILGASLMAGRWGSAA
jgi:hypothetical protein